MTFMKLLFLPLCLGLVGCIHMPTARLRTMGATPTPSPAPSASQVSSCRSTMAWHNAMVLSGAALSGLAASGGAADALTTNKSVQMGIGVGVIISGVLAGVATTAAGITSSTFATDNCQVILQTAVDAASP